MDMEITRAIYSLNYIIILIENTIIKFYSCPREGLPSWSAPPFETTIGDRNVTFIEMVSDLGSSIVLVPVIGVLGNVAIAKAFG